MVSWLAHSCVAVGRLVCGAMWWFTGHGDVNCPAGLIIPVRRPWGLATAGLGVGAATALAARRAAGYAA
ncbi:MAG TPA: hypothetical protein VIJ07_03930, partial [Dermatophilaceae bacterium]